jgi:hypothetical protein
VAAAVRIGAEVDGTKLGDLLGRLRPCFRRVEPFVQAVGSSLIQAAL